MFISRHELRSHLLAQKRLVHVVFNKPPKNMPAPLDKFKGGRTQVSALYDVGDMYRACFIWRDGPSRIERSFYAFLFMRRADGRLLPLARVDYHPSHKGLHAVVNCEENRDLTGRSLPGCKEFSLKLSGNLDPGIDRDRDRLVVEACARLGIRLGPEDDLWA